MSKILRKRIWNGDRVRVIGGKHDGLEGVVTKKEPESGAAAKYVWIRSVNMRPSSVGTKVSVRFVFIVERTKRDTHDRYREYGKKNS